MLEIIRKNTTDLPYSLHDARANQILIQGQKVELYFDQGYFKPVEGDCLRVKGHLEFDGVDLDFCAVYIFELSGNFGSFSGEKLSLQRFVQSFPTMNLEILDETYGYNQSKFTGLLYDGEDVKECFLEIYHLGDMKYIAQR